MQLETINKLFLELSQVATAKTANEIALEDKLKEANLAARKLCDTIEKSGASPELTEISLQASALYKKLE